MKRSQFRFDFPESLVAQTPLPERDHARLLFWDSTHGRHENRNFSELPMILRERFPKAKFESVLLIVNDSRVYPARVRVARVTGGSCEVFVLATTSEDNIPCLLRPLKKLRVGEILHCEASRAPIFEVTRLDPPAVRNISGVSLVELLARYGEMPLPPYIERSPQKMSDPSLGAFDKMRYQTVYAKESGSCAAPTAGLHFTPAVIDNCTQQGISIAPVTLHVGLGTFQPVTADDISQHKMHEELFHVSGETMGRIVSHLDRGLPIVFVGTTSLRCVESAFLLARGFSLANAGAQTRSSVKKVWAAHRDEIIEKLGIVADQWHSTNLFIQPDSEDFCYSTQCGDAIVTNFHQPESTLTMLIASLIGYPSWRRLYDSAVQAEYRLFSYGDSSLLIFPDAIS